MKFRYFIGVDVSKASLDCTVLSEEAVVWHACIANEPTSIRAWLLLLKRTYKAGGKNTLFCLEHTGPYTAYLIGVLRAAPAALWVESALQIKRSLGIQRGKSDRVDSLRIARYASVNRRAYQPFPIERPILTELKALSGLRSRLKQGLLALQRPLQEGSGFQSRRLSGVLARHCRSSLEALAKEGKAVEASMRALIEEDSRLRRQYQILNSVPGIGPVVAVELIVATGEFLKFASSRRFASYCGVAPFEHTSGTSVKGKTKVSALASRKLKTLLYLPALNVIRNPGELRDYYQRKVAEGHPKMSVINAVKNKLLHRIFACIREDRLFEKVKLTV